MTFKGMEDRRVAEAMSTGVPEHAARAMARIYMTGFRECLRSMRDAFSCDPVAYAPAIVALDVALAAIHREMS